MRRSTEKCRTGAASGVLAAFLSLLLPYGARAQGDQADAVSALLGAEAAVQRAIERAAPSVVAIGRVHRGAGEDVAAEFNFNAPGFQRPLADLLDQDVVPTEFGSGVIISADGAILTCYHVLDDPRENDYFVWLSHSAVSGSAPPAGQPIPARLVRHRAQVAAGDPWTDLAVLKIDAMELPVMRMGDASTLRRGSFVVSLGNPYATAQDGSASASLGIVSNLQRRAPPLRDSETELTPPESLREFGTLIQTDARLNLGTSGGALVNLEGEMVGLTTSLAALAGYEQAAGYAIPIDEPTLRTITDLRAGRSPAFGFLGVEPVDAGGGQGALVRRVVPGMPADRAGLRPGDRVVEVDGQRIDSAEALFREMSRRPAESQVRMGVVKAGGGGVQQVVARLGKKRLALGQPGFSQVPEPTWRGMQVDFASALPPGRLMLGNPNRQTEAAILSVDPDTPAWRAGLRAGQLVTAVEGQPVRRPEDFYRAVESERGAVEIEVENRFGAPSTVSVPSP